jgi:hypothetical protein
MKEDKERCVVCGELVPGYDTIYISGKEGSFCHCRRCYNEDVARAMALDFEHPNFEPIILKDTDGVTHEFRFRTHLLPLGLFIDAHEFKNGEIDGYEFRIKGEPDADPLTLFGQLFERIRRALSRKHIQDAGQQGLQITDDKMVRGVINWDDESDGRLPRIMIDGESISWEKFGRILMTYEGWHFKMEIYDPTEER